MLLLTLIVANIQRASKYGSDSSCIVWYPNHLSYITNDGMKPSPHSLIKDTIYLMGKFGHNLIQPLWILLKC